MNLVFLRALKAPSTAFAADAAETRRRAMATKQIEIQRFSVISSKSFEEVVETHLGKLGLNESGPQAAVGDRA